MSTLSFIGSLTGRPVAAAPRPTRIREESNKSRIRKVIMEADGYLTLRPQEVQELKRLLSESGDDPFVTGKFTTDDFERLGMKVSGAEENMGFALPDADEDGDHVEDGMADAYQARFFTPADAIVAPNATPGHDQPIPPEVLAVVRSMHPQPEMEPSTPAPAQTHQAAAPHQPVARRSAPPAQGPVLPPGGPQESVDPHTVANALKKRRQAQARQAQARNRSIVEAHVPDKAQAKLSALGGAAADDGVGDDYLALAMAEAGL